MVCRQCGSEIAPGAAACIKCGTPVYLEQGRSTLILVLGILSLVGCLFFTGVPAWIMGHSDLKKIEMGIISPNERSTTKAGMILGIISSAISVLYLLFIILMIFVALAGEGFRS